MTEIEMLVPEPSRVDMDGLRQVDAGELLRFVLDRESPWSWREPCAIALA